MNDATKLVLTIAIWTSVYTTSMIWVYWGSGLYRKDKRP